MELTYHSLVWPRRHERPTLYILHPQRSDLHRTRQQRVSVLPRSTQEVYCRSKLPYYYQEIEEAAFEGGGRGTDIEFNSADDGIAEEESTRLERYLHLRELHLTGKRARRRV